MNDECMSVTGESQADCSNYDGCHPWFYGGDNPQSLPLMMSHWEHTYGESGVSCDAVARLGQQSRSGKKQDLLKEKEEPERDNSEQRVPEVCKRGKG
jgi:hypothetical protein